MAKYFIEIFDRDCFLSSLDGVEIVDEQFYNDIIELARQCHVCSKYFFQYVIEVKSKNYLSLDVLRRIKNCCRIRRRNGGEKVYMLPRMSDNELYEVLEEIKTEL
ncbi:MAG: hypothetical protein ACTSSJ_01905 [Candidatus Odinarchaeia archaeon]